MATLDITPDRWNSEFCGGSGSSRVSESATGSADLCAGREIPRAADCCKKQSGYEDEMINEEADSVMLPMAGCVNARHPNSRTVATCGFRSKRGTSQRVLTRAAVPMGRLPPTVRDC